MSKLNSGANIWYYRDNQQREIDFMLLAGGMSALIECKWTETPTLKDAKAIVELQEIAQRKGITDLASNVGLVLARTPHCFPLGDRLEAISLRRLREYFVQLTSFCAKILLGNLHAGG